MIACSVVISLKDLIRKLVYTGFASGFARSAVNITSKLININAIAAASKNTSIDHQKGVRVVG